ncbi:DUF6492 family protein [Aestuariivirga litoralis]|uniref:DUF6492 family protein n=1 Tax=Aestuariivirga litoralis TaxID=2650924 RepID=UPI0018C7F3C3|nr:DUF6492 family protein [Aestuariivirga litoralis]MBG1233926.1 hypothetical protein [Aestuariivirga litoralis]
MPEAPEGGKGSGVSWGVVTPSYAGDYERCLLLCRSMDEFLDGNWHHYVIVDKPHFEMFKHLASERRSVWLTEDVVPVKMHLILTLPFLGGRSVWWSRETGLSIGWHMQQMVKIGMAAKVTHQGLAYLDSDVFFLRPYHTDQMVRNGRLRFYQHPPRLKIDDMRNPKFARTSLKMLGLADTGAYNGYVDNFVTWHRQEVLDMCAHLAARYGGSWYRAFRNRIQLSEYMLYGLYVDEVDHNRDERLYPDAVQMCTTIWDDKKLVVTDIENFCRKLEPYEVAIGVQSFLGVSVKQLESEFERAQALYGKGTQHPPARYSGEKGA